MPFAFVINMEVDVERQKLLSPGEASNDESGRVRRVCQDGEDMIREDTTYQAIPEDHSIEIETNVCFDNLYIIDKHTALIVAFVSQIVIEVLIFQFYL